MNILTNEELRLAIADKLGWKTNGTFGVETVWKSPSGGNTLILPDWSTDISAAWELVEEINASGDGLFSINYKTGDNHMDWAAFNWYVEIRLLSDAALKRQAHYITEYDPSAPRAICLAWLAWKEVKK